MEIERKKYMYKVSVIIPIYNVEEFLRECLDSVLNQTLTGIQVIMMDDGSPDGSSKIAKQYAEKYDHFKYVRQKNGGLGNARNNGVKYAEGEYIVFLDSDDFVFPDAYEKMYYAAKQHNCDMAVCNVIRCDSKGYKTSRLHEIAFNSIVSVTHITETHSLMWDTTAWNKMIKREFWYANNFNFPEGMLYEDIPITIPMHFFAKNVAIVKDICYVWRIRDGASKSITQLASSVRNLNDRLKALSMVDKFFDKNVNDDDIKKVKWYKWLTIDVPIFLNQCLMVSDEQLDVFIDIIEGYLTNSVPKEIFSEIPVFYKLKYEAVHKKDKALLRRVRRFELDYFYSIKTCNKGSRIIGRLPLDISKQEEVDMTSTIESMLLKQRVTSIEFDGRRFVIKGYVFEPLVDVPRIEDQHISAYIYCKETRDNIEVKTTQCVFPACSRREGVRTRCDRKMQLFNYDGAGYVIEIDIERDILKSKLDGEFEIVIRYERDGRIKEQALGGTKKQLQEVIEKCIYLNSKNEVKLYRNSGGYLFVKVIHNPVCVVESIYNDDFVIKKINQPIGDVFIRNTKGALRNVDKLQDSSSIAIKHESMFAGVNELVYREENSFVPIKSMQEHRTLHSYSNYSFIDIVGANKVCLIDRVDNEAVAIGAYGNKGLFKIYINWTNGNKSLYSDDSVKVGLYVYDNLEQKHCRIGSSIGNIKDEHLECSIEINLHDINVIQNLYANEWTLFFGVELNGVYEYYPIRCCAELNSIKFQNKYKRFTITQSNNTNNVILAVTKVQDYYTRSNLRKQIVERFVYPLFRRLPIKKKWIVFESMWGTKYSCNPRYFYEFVNENHRDYKCIWSLNDENTPIVGDGVRVRRLSLRYYYYMARAKYFVNNVNFHKTHKKRKNQIEVQTMHGTPLKSIGLDVVSDFPTEKSRCDYIEKCKRWDYLLVQSSFVENLSRTAFCFDKEVLKTGYPRTDVLFEDNRKESIESLKKKLGLPTDKKVIMYAPTWRIKGDHKQMLDVERMKARLSSDYILIQRLHHFSAIGYDSIETDGFVFDFTNYSSIEDLYSITDILITDYSSVMFDYAVLGRPMLFYAYDLDNYRDKLRGLYFDIETEAPGPVLYTTDEVICAIENIDNTIDANKDKVTAFNDKYIEYECKDSSKKIFEIITEQ